MYQYDDPTAAPSLPVPAAPGSAGYFTDGNPGGGVPATILRGDFMNMVMMELLNVVEAAGIAPSKTTYNQLLAAINSLVGPGRLLRRSEYYISSGTQMVSVNGGAGTTTGATTFTRLSQMANARVRIVGGGGGGASTGFVGSNSSSIGTGGCAGGYAEVWLSAAQIGASLAITVGAAGTGPVGGVVAAGGVGGTSSFGTLVSCTGGQGGVCNGQLTGSYITAGTVGGLPSLGTGVSARINAQGNPGGPAIAVSYNVGVSGSGGASGFGGGSAQGVIVSGSGGTSDGRIASGPGSGGSGGLAFNSPSAGGAGGAGGAGLIVVEEYA